MKKFFLILVCVVCLGGFLGWTFLPTILSNILSNHAKTLVKISNIQLVRNGMKLTGIKIYNPPNYSKTPYALSIDTLSIAIPFTHFFNQHIVIPSIKIDEVYVGLEFGFPNLQKGNWATIIQSFEDSNGKEKNLKQHDSSRSILIEHLIIQNVQAELAYPLKNQPNKKLRPIERIELTHLSSKDGASKTEIMDLILQQLFEFLLNEKQVEHILKGLLNDKHPPKDPIDFLKDLFSNEGGEKKNRVK